MSHKTLRGRIFWFLDWLKGGKVKKHLTDLDLIYTSLNQNQVENKIISRLETTLVHSKQSTKFYENFDSSDINNFPVIDKNIIRHNVKLFLSRDFTENHLIPCVTSGSTGTPFKTFQHRDKKYRNIADTLYFARMAGYELGDKLYYFKIWSDYNAKTKILQKLQNIVPIDVLNLKRNSVKIFHQLNQNKSPKAFLGYVSAFETLCKELDKKNHLSPSLQINSIITMSEGLDEYTKRRGREYFNCPILSRYSNIENGILAQQTLHSPNQFIINRASYYIEIMDLDKNEVLPNGNLGRIVVTDYYNRAMPLIRYDTGDLGIKNIENIDGVEQEVLSKIEGRQLDQIFNTNGELISSYIVYKNMWEYTEIEQYQLVQKGQKEYVFKICIDGKFMREEKLTQEFKNYLGADANFKIEYVNEIPLLKSGKRKKVVNEMSLNAEKK